MLNDTGPPECGRHFSITTLAPSSSWRFPKLKLTPHTKSFSFVQDSQRPEGVSCTLELPKMMGGYWEDCFGKDHM